MRNAAQAVHAAQLAADQKAAREAELLEGALCKRTCMLPAAAEAAEQHAQEAWRSMAQQGCQGATLERGEAAAAVCSICAW